MIVPAGWWLALLMATPGGAAGWQVDEATGAATRDRPNVVLLLLDDVGTVLDDVGTAESIARCGAATGCE